MPKKIISASIEQTTIDKVKKISKKQHRSFSAMVDMLLLIAIESENKKGKL